MLKTCFLPILIALISLLAIVGCSGPGTTTPGPHFFNAGLFKAEAPTGLRARNPALTDYQPLVVDPDILREYFVNGGDSVKIQVPYMDSVLTLELERVEVFTDGLVSVSTDSGQVAYTPGHFYHGVIRDHPGSIVSLSIFENDITGIISSPALGQLNIGKTAARSFIIYDPRDATDTIRFDCASPDGGYTTPELNRLQSIQGLRQKVAQAPGTVPCVSVDFELTYEAYQQFKTVPATVNWLTALFTGVKALYKAEGIEITIKSIYVWTQDDGYSDNPNTALSQLKTKRTSDPAFTGNFVHLVRVQSNNLSGLAYVGVLCVPQYRFGVSAVLSSYATYPAFSWSTEVLTHELGHNMGSQHTQWCGWPGGAIDNCYAVEGSCAPGPAPVNGGTIMSYCHMTSYGIKFSNGFGPLPGAKIRDYYSKASCVSCTVAAPASCTDGIKNQNEWEIDCGGVCPPCPNCTDGIKNQNETGIDCGGVCPPCPVIPAGDPLISIDKPARQSTNYNSVNSYPASKAFDGRACPLHGANFNHTGYEQMPWIEVDLLASYRISKISIVNRCDCCLERIKKFKLFVSNTPVSSYSTAGQVYEFNSATPFSVLDIPVIASGRYVRVWVDNSPGRNWLHLSEISVQGLPGTVVCKDSTIKVTYLAVKDSVIQVCR